MNNKTTLLSSIGALAGLAYAFKSGKEFWGYVGFFALGAIAGNLVGMITTSIAQPNSASKNASESASDSPSNMMAKPAANEAKEKPTEKFGMVDSVTAIY